MCATCGCSGTAEIRLFTGDHEHAGHAHEGGAQEGHAHESREHNGHDHGRTVELQQKVLAKNDRLAEANRDWLGLRVLAPPG